MAFSQFLASRRDAAKALVACLGKHFAYVSILGTDVGGTRVTVNKNTAAIGEGGGECGFVIKMQNGGAFYEHSLCDIDDDPEVLCERILATLTVPRTLTDAAMRLEPPADEPLVRDFVRENDYKSYTDAQLLDFCRTLKDDILERDSEHILNAVAALSTLTVSKLFISKNRELSQCYGWANGFAVAVYRDGEKMVQVREVEGENDLRTVMAQLPKKIDNLIDKARHLVKATPITPGVYDVITAPSITGLIAHEAFGHGVEMDQFVKERALAKQYVGKYVASPICNMHDGAAAADSVASFFFDDDGVLAHDTQIIKDGVLVAGLCDLTSATELGVPPTGNGRRESFKRKAYARMTNTYFEAGKDKLCDMIASIKHGYMLFETNNGMEDPKNWQIQCTAEYGIEIVDGKLTENYVSPVVMSGYVPDLLKSISMVSDDFQVIGAGSCGKGYKEWVRVSDGGPALKVRCKLS
ncbi:MAG: TldD/PmbA family protein [Clostridia bacterium]|nr:TldD/PmbA family protein [Clostridia bacterium]